MTAANHFQVRELHRIAELMGRLHKALNGMHGDQDIIKVKLGTVKVRDVNGQVLGSIVHVRGEFQFKAAA